MCLFFFFNDTATTEIYTLSLHDALPIWGLSILLILSKNQLFVSLILSIVFFVSISFISALIFIISLLLLTLGFVCSSFSDRKSTRLNSSHANISYAVFCLKKKNNS